jgi:hypothetical protein
MRIILDNFFQLSAQNAGMAVVWVLLTIYMGLVLTCLLDIVTRKRIMAFKLAWILLVVLLPFIGMAGYCIFCLCTAEYSLLSQLVVKSQSGKKVVK